MSKHLVGRLIFVDRREKGMTLKEYSEELGISLSYLSDIEQGNRLVFPDLGSFNRILKHVGYQAEIKLNKIGVEEVEE